MREQNEDQFNLFSTPDTDDKASVYTPKIEVISASFVAAEKCDWHDLFEGYDELYAITFSSGINFVNNVVSQFRHAEIIYGCENVVDSGTAAVISMQAKVIQSIAKSKSAKAMADRLEEGTLELYVSRATKSHEKIFILRAEDGRTRVITGSANMSASAFYGMQRENIVRFDEQAAFDHYKELFDNFKSACSDSISHTTLAASIVDGDYLEDNIEEIPIIKTIEKEKAIYLEAPPDESGDAELVAGILGFEKELKPMLPKEKKSEGKFLLSGEITREFKRKYRENKEVQKIREKKLPKLHIDYENSTMNFNGKGISLTPEQSAIDGDIRCLTNYFTGFSSFNGDTEKSKKAYFSFMNWYFASVFIPYLRLVAHKNNYDMTPFPVFGIIYGDSNGGKSTFTKLLSKMMCGQKVPLNSSNDFTSSDITDLKRGREGLPIIVDDLAKAQFQNHNEKIIKDDEWGIPEGFVNYPAVVITTNKLPAVSADISKRAVTCHIDAKINKEDGARQSKKINESMKTASTAFFGEYVARMLVQIEQMVQAMKTEEDYFPDIFKASSDVICSIVEESRGELPSFMSRLGYADYFGDKAVSQNAMEKLLRAWKYERKQFKTDRRMNKLTYTCPENGRYHELKYIYDELPPSLNAQLNATNIVMDLDQAEKLFETKFKTRFFS